MLAAKAEKVRDDAQQRHRHSQQQREPIFPLCISLPMDWSPDSYPDFRRPSVGGITSIPAEPVPRPFVYSSPGRMGGWMDG